MFCLIPDSCRPRRVNSKVGDLLLGGLLTAFLLAGTHPVAAVDLLSPFKNLLGSDDSTIIWRDNGAFVKITEQDWDRKHTKAPRNQHPAQINPNELALALAAIETWDTEGLSNRQIHVFSQHSIQQLVTPLVEALNRADPDQDVVFAITDEHEELSGVRTTAGRMFMQDGELNIIFGDVLASGGYDDDTSHYAKPHRAGKRMESLSRSTRVAAGPGMRLWETEFSSRDDWLIVHMGQTEAAYRGAPIQSISPPVQAQSTARVAPAASVASAPVSGDQLQRWQQREEMARARKQMEATQGAAPAVVAPAAPAPAPVATTPAPAARPVPVPVRTPAPTASAAPPIAAAVQTAPVYNSSLPTAESHNDKRVDERLTTLKSLHDRGLITKDEFDAKRREILDQL
jgi:hypothetical protein